MGATNTWLPSSVSRVGACVLGFSIALNVFTLVTLQSGFIEINIRCRTALEQKANRGAVLETKEIVPIAVSSRGSESEEREDEATGKEPDEAPIYEAAKEVAVTETKPKSSEPYKTPYEHRWPGFDLPDWARKTKGNFTNDLGPIADEDSICFIHVGKTAGSSLGCQLGFQLHCSVTDKVEDGLLPQYTKHTFHRGVNDCPDKVAYYLYTLRNPIERIRSWYTYDRPPRLQVECNFKTLNQLAEIGLDAEGDTSQTCKYRARSSVQGVERFGNHAYFNYEYYYKRIDPHVKMFVARTEHLQEDWNSMEAYLGGNNTKDNFPRRNASQKSAEELYLSPKGKMLLCHALCQEIQMYKALLEGALNLTPEQIKTSIDELADSCPREARTSACSPLVKKIGS